MSGPGGAPRGLFDSRWFGLAASAALAVAALFAYSNTFSVPFTFDDVSAILENRRIRSLENLPSLLFSGRGLTMATFALNYAAGGYSPAGYHAVNLAVHAINGILAYLLLARVFAFATETAAARRLAFFAALIFVVHPLQTQAVTYVVQRMESLQALFYLAALIFFLKGAGEAKAGARAALYAAVAVCYVLAFKSKEVAFTLPAVLFLLDLFFVSSFRPREAARRWPLYAALVALMLYFGYTTVAPVGGFDASETVATAPAPAAAQGAEAGAVAAVAAKRATAGFAIGAITPREYLLTEFNVIVYYLTLIVAPFNQNIDYDFPVAHGLFETPVMREGTVLNYPIPMPAVSLAVLLAMAGAAIYLAARSAAAGRATRGAIIAAFVFWFFIILSPTSSFIPILDVIFEHRVYLASLGIIASGVLLLDSLVCSVLGGDA